MSKTTILVIEDEVDVRLGYQVLLKANDYNTVFAADTTSAVSEARKSKPDLIVLDLGLPAGDGFIVLERFQANMNLAGIPVVVVSARDPQANKERALKAGARAYLQKPWNDDELLATIAQLVGRPASASQPVGSALQGRVDI